MSKSNPSGSPAPLTEAAVYKVTPTRIFAYKKRSTDPSKIQTVQIRHSEVWKHFKDLVDPPPGYKVIGHIGPNYGHPDDIDLLDTGKPALIEPDSDAVLQKDASAKKFGAPGDALKGKAKKPPAGQPKAPEEPAAPEPKAPEEPPVAAPEPDAGPSKEAPAWAPPQPPDASEEDIQKAIKVALGKLAAGESFGKISLIKFLRSVVMASGEKYLGLKVAKDTVEKLHADGIIEIDAGWNVTLKAKAEPEVDTSKEEPVDPDEMAAAVAATLAKLKSGHQFSRIAFMGHVRTQLDYKKWGLQDVVNAFVELQKTGVIHVDAQHNVHLGPAPKSEPQPAAVTPQPEKPAVKPVDVDADVADQVKDTSAPTFHGILLQLIKNEGGDSGISTVLLKDILKVNGGLGDDVVEPILVDLVAKKLAHVKVKEGVVKIFYGPFPKETPVQVEPPAPPAEPEKAVPVEPEKPSFKPTWSQPDAGEPIDLGKLPDEAFGFYMSDWLMEAAAVWGLDSYKKGVLKGLLQQSLDEIYGPGSASAAMDGAQALAIEIGKYGVDQIKDDNSKQFKDLYGFNWRVEHPIAKRTIELWGSWKAEKEDAYDPQPELAVGTAPEEPKPAATVVPPEEDTKDDAKVVDAAVAPAPVAPPLTSNSPSKIKAYSKEETGIFHPEDFAILDNKLVLRKFFTNAKNKYFADKKEKEVHAYMAAKYGPGWKEEYDKVQNNLKSTLSKHNYYKKSKDGYEQLVKAYGADWINTHPTLAAVWAGQKPDAAPVVINQPVVDVAPTPKTADEILGGEKAYPEHMMGTFGPKDFLQLMIWKHHINAMEDVLGSNAAHVVEKEITAIVNAKYGPMSLGKHTDLEDAYEGTFSPEDLEKIRINLVDKLKQSYGGNWFAELPLYKQAQANLAAPKPSLSPTPGADGGLAPGTPSKVTEFTQKETGSIHPEDYTIMQYVSDFRKAWKDKYGQAVAMARDAALEKYFAQKYGSDWLVKRGSIYNWLASKYGGHANSVKHINAINQLKAAYPDFSETHPTVKAAIKGLPEAKLASITAADILPGKHTAFTAFSQEQAEKFHPEDLYILMRRHDILNDFYTKYGDDAGADKYNSTLKYFKAKYGDDVLATVNQIKYALDAQDPDFHNKLVNGEKEMESIYGVEWMTTHPSVADALGGHSPPQSLGTPSAQHGKGSYKDFTPDGPSVVKSITPEMAGGWHPEELTLWRYRETLNSIAENLYGVDAAAIWYSKFHAYYEAKYGADYVSKGDSIHNKIPYSVWVVAKGELKPEKDPDGSWEPLFQTHPVLQAIEAGVQPSPVNVPLHAANVKPQSNPSKFSVYSDVGFGTGVFAPEDFAILANSHLLWDALQKAHGKQSGDKYTKVLHYLQTKYGSDAQAVAQAMNSAGGGQVTAGKVSDQLKHAYGQSWISGHPSVVAALGGEEPTPIGTSATPAAVTPGAAAAQAKAKPKKISPTTSPTISDPEPFKGSIPTPGQLTFKSDAKHLGGAFQKSIYVDKDGKQWLFKPAITGSGKIKLYSAYGAQGFASLARLIKPNHIPISKLDLNGKAGTIQPLLDHDNGKLKTLSGVDPSELSPVEREDVGSEHLLDWLFSQHDTHPANLVRTKDGHILGIDKDQVFRFIDSDKLSLDYHPNEGEEEPFYNKFWRDWSNNQFEFDPTSLASYVDKIEAISPQDLEQAVLPYAQTLFPNDSADQAVFVQKVKNRKNTLRKKFETFINTLYKKRAGKEGHFSFEGGWDTDPNAPKVKKVTQTGHEIIQTHQAKVQNYTDKNGVSDPSKVTIKLHNGQAADKLEKLLTELGISHSGIKHGGQYHMAFVSKAELDKIKKVTEVTELPSSKVSPPPPVPKYLPEHSVFKGQKPNATALSDIEDQKLNMTGKAFHVGGSLVEGQTLKVKKFIDKQGNPYHLFTFKLREPAWSAISSGTANSHSIPTAKFDDSKDAFVEQSVDGMDHNLTVNTKKWSDKHSEIFLIHPKSKKTAHQSEDYTHFAMKGTVFAKIRPASGETLETAFRKMLDKMQPGLADGVLADPTEEEQEVMKLARALWDKSPKAAQGLTPGDYTVDTLKKLCKKAGLKQEYLDAIETVEAFPGHVTHIKRGRWKDLAKDSNGNPALKFFYVGYSNPVRLVNVMKQGAMGIWERTFSGVDNNAASFGSDLSEGGADSIYTRVSIEKSAHHGFSGGVSGTYQLIFPPDEADRLDLYGYTVDSYGACHSGASNGHVWDSRKGSDDYFQSLQDGKWTGGTEIMFRKGIDASRILRVNCVNNDARNELIKQFRDAGLVEVNGVPVEDFVVVASDQGSVYNKYIKPLGY